jgi:hypothetical protein
MEISVLFSHKIRPAAIETAFAPALACKKAPSFYKENEGTFYRTIHLFKMAGHFPAGWTP